MPKVRFVEGTPEDYSTIYDTEWPIAPRVGEFLSITIAEQVMDWEITRVCHVAGDDEELIGTLARIKELPKQRTYSDAQRVSDNAKIAAANRARNKGIV
jgi:GTP-dependent phosphoenolpyruvate carboxykinase